MITDDSTLLEARNWLRERALNGGAKCPCCHQQTKVYRRKMTATTGRVMIAMHRAAGTDWVHVPDLMRDVMPDVAHQGGYATLAQHWGLITESPDIREDGGRAGWWRLTRAGEAFVTGHHRVRCYAHLYDGRCLGKTGDLVDITNVLGTKFSYDALMAGA